MEEEILTGGRVTAQVVRRGEFVHRTPCKNAAFVHQVLEFLEAGGVEGVPRYRGLDQQGREVLTFLPGQVPPGSAPAWGSASTARWSGWPKACSPPPSRPPPPASGPAAARRGSGAFGTASTRGACNRKEQKEGRLAKGIGEVGAVHHLGGVLGVGVQAAGTVPYTPQTKKRLDQRSGRFCRDRS